MARDVLTELHGNLVGIDRDGALVVRSGIIRSEDGSPVSFPDGIDGVVGSETVLADEGGTGFSSYTIGDILYANSTTTLAKLGIGTNEYSLVVKAGVPSWSLPISLGTVTTGTWAATAVAAIYGGTGQTTYSRGQMLYASNSTTLAKLSIGNDGQVLTAATDPTWAYPRVRQRSVSADYTIQDVDAGAHIYHPSADTSARTWTIPANSSVAFPIGTALTFVNDSSAGVITVAITTDTMVLAGTGTTGSRTLAANGIATALKIGTARWMISGTGLT